MRVLHVSAYFAPAFSYGGPPRSILGLCKALLHEGVEVEVFTTTANGLSPEFPESHHVYEGVPVSYFARNFPRRCFHARNLRPALHAAISKFDVVHVHGLWNYADWAAVREARAARVPYLISPRGMLEPGAMKRRGLRKKVAYPLIEARGLKHAGLLHATSDAEFQTLRTLLPNVPAIRIPNGVEGIVDQDRYRGQLRRELGIGEADPIIAWLGRIHPIKRLDLLVKAYARLKSTRAHLVIAGPDECGYQAVIEQMLDVENGFVHWLGEIGGERKHRFFSDADVLVLCSDSESFGMSVIEAMAAGVPIVATHACPWGELETVGCGHWVAQDAHFIANGIADVLADRSRGRSMGAKGQALVAERYTWAAIAREFIACYSNLSTSA